MSMTLDDASNALPTAGISKIRVLLIFVGLVLGMLLFALDQTVFSSALPTIVGELHGVNHMLWVTTAYILASTIMMLVYGRLSDLFDRKILFVLAITLFLAGTVVGGMAQDMTMLIIGRAVQGIGGGGLMVLAQSIIGYIVPPRQKGKYLGIMGLAFAIPTVAGPLLGGWLTDPHHVLGLVTNWRWAFWINIPLGIIALASAIVFLPALKSGVIKPKIDYAGMALLAGATASLVLVTTWGGTTYAWLSPQIFGLLGMMVVCAVGLVIVERRIERRGGQPVLPERLFKDKDFVLVTVSGMLMGVALFGTIFYLPTYLQMVAGSTAAKSGLYMIPMMLGMLIMAGGMGWAMSHTGRYKWICPTGMGIAGIAFGLMSMMTPATPIWQILCLLGLLGIGFGMCIQTLVMIAQNQFSVEIVGTATSTNNYFREIGASIGSAFVGSLFVSKLTSLLSSRMPAGLSFGKNSITSLTPTAVASYPKPIHDILVHAYNDALTPVFLYMVPFVSIACVLLVFVKEKPLSHDIEREGHSFL